MISPQNKNKISKKSLFLGSVIIALLFLFFFYQEKTVSFFSAPIIVVSRPFLSASNGLGEWLNKNLVLFKDKQKLLEENDRLKNKNAELETRALFFKETEKERDDLKNIFASAPGMDPKNFILANILSRPPKSPFDSLLVNMGSNSGVQTGMQVTAYGNILLGHITDVYEKESKVRLVSSPDEETNVLLLSSSIQTSAKGKGNGNMEILVPRTLEVSVGENISTMGSNPFILGTIEKIESELTEPFQKLLFRLPVNIQDIKYVLIKK